PTASRLSVELTQAPPPASVQQVSNQLCSARKTPAAFWLSLPARNERGESRREGKLFKRASSPRPSPPIRGGEGEKTRLRAQSTSFAEHNWLATCETADQA